MVLTKRTSNLPLICQICGDIARGINFEVMTCMSCKAFFRRHALQSKNFQCQLNSNCEITRLTRSACSPCRLRKCFSFGMNPQLIRYTSQNSRRFLKKKNQLLPKPLPLNLLQNDCSTLTKIEWNLLSNIIHAYDENNSMEYIKSLIEQQSSLPPKLRLKSTIILDIIGVFYLTTQSFIKRIPFFNDLSIDARRAVIQHNASTTGSYNSIFIIRETNAIDNSAYAVGCCNLYGEEIFNLLKKFISKLEQNGILFKIMLLILAFAGNCSIVIPDYSENRAIIESTISLNRIQNILVTMLWKYLNYQYGFLGAVQCFNSFIKFILNILRCKEERRNAQHSNMVDRIIENTARSLIIDD